VSSVEISVRDTSTITVPVGASAHELSAAFSSLASDGEYQLKEAALIEDGNQRDPYVTAVRLTFVKEAR
jgi:hypothetical protein